MRPITAIFSLLAFVAAAIAEPVESPEEPLGGNLREAALDNLLSERDSDKKFESAIAAARKNGISEQAILEARFLYHVDRREDDAVAAMLPEFLKRREDFKIGDSAIFSVKEDWLAVVEYVQAIAAIRKGDKAGFKTHITEAFWLSPRQASAFAPHIERMRLEEAMDSVRLDFETKLTVLDSGNEVTLKSLLSGKKAMLLHFWSPASPESEASLPDYIATAATLGEKGIAMISILPGDAPATLTDARKTIQALGTKPPGEWLVDRKEAPLARDLRVQSFPTLILVSNEGRVLFNGDPTDEGFWESLEKLDPRIIRPPLPGAGE